MRATSLLYFIALCLFLSCEKEPEKLYFEETKFNTESNQIVQVTIPVASGKDDAASLINDTLEARIASILQIGDPELHSDRTIEESIDNYNTEYNKFKHDFPEEPMTWEADIEGEISYESESLISISLSSYTFAGGAHGMSSVNFLNFDPKTGKTFDMDDLISDTLTFEEIAKRYFQKEVLDKDKLLFDGNGFTLPENLGFDEEGVIFLYNPYEIAPYSTGMIEFRIPYTDLGNSLTYYTK